ncbi:MAG: DNA topoisomerase IV subunit B, partial [Thermoplasmata archaeon]|nr:DNA topoisomerase IV subunit B [Thermoplasmata archaeon]
MKTGASPKDAGKGKKSGEEKPEREWYDAKSIKVLKGLEGVRKRPSMYVGDTGKRGLHHILEEVVDNAIDEHLAGFCDKIAVTIHKNGSATITDNGRGIPVDMHPEAKKPALELVMTTLHAGGKFDTKSYRISGGLHGVGVSVTNALSEWLKAEVKRDGRTYTQSYRKGIASSKLQEGKRTEETGTTISFKPDAGIFSETVFDFELLAARLEELSYLNAGLRIEVTDERTGKHKSFIHSGGIKSFVKHLNRTKSPIHPEPIYFSQKNTKYELEVAMQYTSGYLRTMFSFVNGINTIEGGTHEEGWRGALTRAVNKYIEEKESMQL